MGDGDSHERDLVRGVNLESILHGASGRPCMPTDGKIYFEIESSVPVVGVEFSLVDQTTGTVPILARFEDQTRDILGCAALLPSFLWPGKINDIGRLASIVGVI